MAEAKDGDTVKVHYTGRLGDGTVFDSTRDRDPLEFTIGQGQIIPGFERAVLGMSEGQSKTAQVSAEQAYGVYREEMLVSVQLDRLPEGFEPEVGKRLQLRHSEGQWIGVVVAEVSGETVTLDANHPLAGQDLTFDIELMEVA